MVGSRARGADDVQLLLEPFGQLVSCSLSYSDTGRPLGVACATFASSESAQACVGSASLRSAGISASRVRAVETSVVARLRPKPTHVVYIGGLPRELFERDLESYLSQFGRVREIVMPRLVYDKASERAKREANRGFAFAVFDDPESVEHVCAMRRHIVWDRFVTVQARSDGVALPRD